MSQTKNKQWSKSAEMKENEFGKIIKNNWKYKNGSWTRCNCKIDNFINNIHPDQAVSSQGTHLAMNFERREEGKTYKMKFLFFCFGIVKRSFSISI